jgi:hypothetical protein
VAARVSPPLVVGLSAVIVAVTEQQPRVLTVRKRHAAALPSGPLALEAGLTLERSLRGFVQAQAGLDLGYVEQLYTFGDRYREPRGPRMVSISYLALVLEESRAVAGDARWWHVYDFLPWEDWRFGAPPLVAGRLAPALLRWAAATEDRRMRAQRRERVDIAFGLHGSAWDAERVLERYELLFEVGLVDEAQRAGVSRAAGETVGQPMDLDHRRMLATALGRLRGKIRYRPVVFELLPPRFTLFQLQKVVEALAGVKLHKQNFRRLVESAGLVEGTDEVEERTGGRPAELFRFRRDVLRERPAPGVGIPKAR